VPSAVLWFPAEPYFKAKDHIILWQQFASSNDAQTAVHSLPQIVNHESDRWKRTYLRWLEHLGSSGAGNKTLEQQLRIRPDLSYWWLTLPTQFSFSQDALVYKSLRLWAFVELAERLDFSEIEIVGADADVLTVLQDWGKQTGRKITATRTKSKRVSGIPRFRSFLLSNNVLVQFSIAAVRIAREFAIYGLKFHARSRKAVPEKTELTIVDYFVNFLIDSTQTSRYRSNYWGPLPEHLVVSDTPVHWIHIDYRSAEVASVLEARNAITKLNDNNSSQRHSLLQDQMNLRILFKVIRQYLAIVRMGLGVNGAKFSWVNPQSGLDMWPIAKRPWRRWFYGLDAAQNAIWLILFEGVLSKKKTSGACLYLMENQPWELALINCWQSTIGEQIAGVPHSVVRPWDLRYALGASASQASPTAGPPRPDVILVNGPAAHEVLTQNGFSPKKIVAVEALRYLQNWETPDRERQESPVKSVNAKLLALGEYDPRLVATQIELLNSLVEERFQTLSITYRPHPASAGQLTGLDRRIRLSMTSSISSDLAKTDLAFCSSVSSASLDAILCGVPFITFRDGSVLDGQITRALDGFSITNSGDLISAVDHFVARDSFDHIPIEGVFFLDNELRRWKSMLSKL
jgi:surface carbohydrate biosynthesis protein (TIGR04326 family)